ncbi:MAG: ABC transporter ATP-binding protein [Alphaproteobacteria bacterium]|nr:ABC transporter ATP-binding protein [Alphaproteobacteria bacterium]
MSAGDYIRIENITKRFGSFHAVDNADFGIKQGEFFSLLGPSGCGKTTLLRMIAGFEFPTEGEIYIDGQPVTGVPANKRPTNMVFQSYAIFPHLDVYDNVAYGLRKLRLDKAELDRRVKEALAMIRMDGFETRKADQMSGGQRQRVALARALVNRPKVLLLDEPLGALDKKLREQMQFELRSLQQNVGITFIFVTHDQEEALSLSDRIAVMQKGKVMQIATPRELYESPTTREVADFIGTINLLNGTVKSKDDKVAVVEAQGLGLVNVPLPADHAFAPAGAEILVGARPEKLDVVRGAPHPGEKGIKGDIGACAYLGDRNHYQVTIAGRAEPLQVATEQGDRSTLASFMPGEQVTISWGDNSLVLLPRT